MLVCPGTMWHGVPRDDVCSPCRFALFISSCTWLSMSDMSVSGVSVTCAVGVVEVLLLCGPENMFIIMPQIPSAMNTTAAIRQPCRRRFGGGCTIIIGGGWKYGCCGGG